MTPPIEGIDGAFPYDTYRPHQREIIEEAAVALWEEDYETVLINAPTGIGKSGINVTLAELAGRAFYTTPQKKLRSQLEADTDLSRYYAVLRGRDGYHCPASLSPGKQQQLEEEELPTCAECPIYRSNAESRSCSSTLGCPYWAAKKRAMGADTAVLTFAYLIVDGFLPVQGGGQQISFEDRNLLIVDECHKLEEQVASLFAGFAVSENTLPEKVYGGAAARVAPDETQFDAVRDTLDRVYRRAQRRIPPVLWDDMTHEERKCKSFCRRYEYCCSEVDEHERTWVVDVDRRKESVKVSPVKVDRFLREHVWSRTDKQVLSTATIQHADNPAKWLSKIGLDPSQTKVIQRPMPFPVENRPINTDWMLGKFSGGGDEDYWNGIERVIWSLCQNHSGEKGVIHTASYARARRLYERFGDRATLDEPSADSEERLRQWRDDRTKQIFLSPAVMDGVDLPDEACRWQVLLKVPYPSPAESRVEYLLNERKEWDWYYATTAQSIIQSVGRGVRHSEDHCTYYVLDKCFEDVMNRAGVPQWFRDAIGKDRAVVHP